MDAKEFKQIFLPYHKILYQSAYSLTKNTSDAEDLVQELYLRLWLKRNEISHDKRNKSYLVAMLRNLYIDTTRHIRLSIAETNKTDIIDDKNNPVSQLIDKDNNCQINKLVENLSDREKTIIRLHIEKEMDYKDLQRSTGLSQSNLRVIVTRTKQKIRNQFNKINKVWKNQE